MGFRRTLDAKTDADRIRFGDVVRVPAFAALYVAETQSTVGDQLARVALSVLVYARTGSTVETALAYALTFLPAIVGGGVLSGVADRFSRRKVMIGVDVTRGALVGCMALPHVPIALLFALLVVAVFLGPAFTAAEVSLLATIFDAEHYRVATGLRMITNQVAQVAGFAVGGVLVTAIGARPALAVDAATYVVSAVIVSSGRRALRPSAGRHREPEAAAPMSLGASVRALWGDPKLRALVALSWLAGFFVAPEGLAVPYARALGGGSDAVGALLTTIPLGSVIGAFLLLRALPAQRRQQLIAPLAALAGIPLALCAASPPLGISLALWTLSGLFAAYQLDAITGLVQSVSDNWRGRVVSVAAAGLTAAQGIGLIVFGLVASATDPGTAIAVAGLAGSACALALWAPLRRAEQTNSWAPTLPPSDTKLS